MEDIIKALALKNELDGLRPIDSEQETRIMQKFRLDWNYHSNHLEGNSLNYGETKALLLFGITAQGKPLKDHFEITGHNEAINWVIDMIEGKRPLTENFIRELHKLLLKEPYEVDALTPDGKPTKKKINVGSYKSTANHVKTKTGEIFYFASPEETPSKMFDLLQWYDEKAKENETNFIFLAAEFHYKFIRIHPFDDGNGRTARILMNFILMQFGFPPVIIKTGDKDNYFAALQLADAGNIEAFINYIAKNLVHSLELMIAGAKGENIEEEDDLDKEIALLEQRLNGYSEKIVKAKTIDNINDILNNTIISIAHSIDKKLEIINKQILSKSIYIDDGSENKMYNYFEKAKNTGCIRIKINFNSITKKGLENFSFNSNIDFYFNQLNYLVKINNENSSIYIKYYENLSKQEIEFVSKTIIKNYIRELNIFMDNRNL